MTTATINYSPNGDTKSDAVRELKGVITNTGTRQIALALQTGSSFSISMARFGGDLVNDKTDDELRAATDIFGKVYQCGSDAISCRLQDDDVIEYSIFLSADVGNFKIGNYGLYDDEGNLILLVVLNELVSKTNGTSASGPNALSFVPLVQYANVTGAINVNVETSGNASIPVVMNTGDIPDGTKSPYSSYIVERDPTFGNVGNLYIFSNNSWEGMTPSSIGHYLYQNLQNLGIKYNEVVNESMSTTVLSGSRGSTTVVVQGAYDLPPYTQYAVNGDGISPETVASKSDSYKFTQQSYLLGDPIQGNIGYQDPVEVQTSHVEISKATYPCYSQITSNQIVLDGVYSFLDDDTTYYVTGEYIPDNTMIVQSKPQEHDTIIRNKVQITPGILIQVPAQHQCILTAISHYSVQVQSVNLATESLVVSCPVDLPNVSDLITIEGTFNRIIQAGKPPTVVVVINSCVKNSDGTYTLIVDGIDNIVANSFGEVKVTQISKTTLRNGATAGQTEIDLDGSFDTALTEYYLSGDAFQQGTRILDYVPTLQNTTTFTISNTIKAPDFVENVVVQANKTVEQNFQTTVSVPAFNNATSLNVAGSFDNVKYVKVDGHLYPVKQVTDNTNTASRTTITLSKPLLTDLKGGATLTLINPDTPIGDFNVLQRVMAQFINKQDSQAYMVKLQELLEDQYNAGKQQLIDQANTLANNMGSQVSGTLSNLGTNVTTLQTNLAAEIARAEKQENALWQGKFDRTGGTLSGSLNVQDTLNVLSSTNGNPVFNITGISGTISATPEQDTGGNYHASLSYTNPNGTQQKWLFKDNGTITLPTGATLLTSTTPNVSIQTFTVSEVTPGQFIKFPSMFTSDDITLTLTPTSQGYVTVVTYTGKTKVGFEVNFLCYDQQGNLMPKDDVVLPELSVYAVGEVSYS